MDRDRAGQLRDFQEALPIDARRHDAAPFCYRPTQRAPDRLVPLTAPVNAAGRLAEVIVTEKKL